MSPKNQNKTPRSFDDLGELRRQLAEGKGRETDELRGNPEDYFKKKRLAKEERDFTSGKSKKGGNLTGRKRGAFGSRKSRKENKESMDLSDELLGDDSLKGNMEEHRTQEMKRYPRRDVFSLRDFKFEASLPSGEEKLKYAIDVTKDEMDLLEEVRAYLINPKDNKIPKPDYKYLNGQTQESIEEKIESRENDLELLEESLEKFLKKVPFEKNKEKLPKPTIKEIGDKKTIISQIKILEHEIKGLEQDIKCSPEDKKKILKTEKQKKEKDLLYKRAVLDMYNSGLKEDEIKNLSNFSEYIDQKETAKALLRRDFSHEDILGLTEIEKKEILNKNLDKKTFISSYQDRVFVEKNKGESPTSFFELKIV
ncbi:MAG: hypothetical protein R3B55_00820 [Candidatus Paceibacterota bacterium]